MKKLIIPLLFICSISFGQLFSPHNAESNIGCDTNITEVTIGTQTWMRKNLAVTKYNDNTNIPKVTDNAAWAALTTPAYCWFDNDSSTYAATYGALYNWYAVNTGKLCPTGWHVPSNAEFETLITFLGGSSVAGGKLKEVGTAHWDSPNTGAIDTLCFTALGAGFRYDNGTYAYIKDFGTFHSTDIDYGVISYYYYLRKSSESFYPDLKENFGFSVRCIKDTFADWFLPSRSELQQMINNLREYNVGGFSENHYWSSTQWEPTYSDTYALLEDDEPAEKTFHFCVRACRSFTTSSSSSYVIRGEGRAGGLIFYINDNGNGTYTYYEAAPSDQSIECVWSNITDTSVGTTSSSIGSGQANTLLIIGQAGHTNSAAKLCSDLIIR